MFVVFFVAGLILSASLAWAGLVRQELRFSKNQLWTGRKARAAGVFSLFVSLVLIGGILWAVWLMISGR